MAAGTRAALKWLLRLHDWPLRFQIAAILLVSSALPLGLWAYWDLQASKAQAAESMKALLQARADQIARELDGFNLGYMRAVNRIARFPATVNYCAARPQRALLKQPLMDILDTFPGSDDGIRGTGLIGANGIVIAATESRLLGMDLSNRVGVQLALQGRMTVTDPFVSSAQSGMVPSIAYFAPLKDATGRIQCVAVIWVRAEAMWKAMHNSNALAGTGSFAVLFDHLGIRIGHTYSNDIVFRPGGKLAPEVFESLVTQRRFGEQTRTLLNDVRSFPEQFERARATAPDLSVFHGFAPVNRLWNYGVARRFQTVDWTVFYMVPEADFVAQTTAMSRQRLALASLVIAALAIAGAILAGRLTRPILRLVQATRALAQGDLSVRVDNGRADEIGVLGASFDGMAGQLQAQAERLQQAHDELEHRVQERTQALEHEVAERRRAEEAIRESQALLHGIVDNSGAVIYVKDLDGRYLLVNRSYTRLMNFEKQDILGKTDAELFGATAALSFRAMDQRVMDAGTPQTGEESLRLEDGEHTYISVKCPLTDAEGRLRGVFGVSTDITEQKRAEVRIRSQLERMQLLDQITTAIGERQDLSSIYQVVIRSVEDSLPADLVCVYRYNTADATLTVMHVSAREVFPLLNLAQDGHKTFPVDANGMARCVRGELVYKADTLAIPFPFAQRLAGAGLRSAVLAPLLTEGTVFGVLLVARRHPRAFTSGECEFLRQLSAHVALAARQTQLHTELQQAYDELRQSQHTVMQHERLRALGQMASGIAHDINNAISPIVLYTEELLEREPNLSERGRARLATIIRAIDDVTATVARMREFYRQRESLVDPKEVQLNQIASQVIEFTKARWSDMPLQRGIVIEQSMSLEPDLPVILGVESEIREALINLVFNAVDAMPSGGSLSLRTRDLSSEGKVEIEVADTGLGMDEETRRRCLEPFFTTKGERGTGLGLSMVYGIAQRHGADLEVESQLGLGTTFRLRFSVAPARQSNPSVESIPIAPSRNLRILVVDDDPLILRSLQETLEADGHMVTVANGGKEALSVLQRSHPTSFDAVITDLGMPYVDGRQVAAAVKEVAPTLPVILLTGWGQRLIEDGDIPDCVDRVLSKPPKMRDLRAALAQLVVK